MVTPENSNDNATAPVAMAEAAEPHAHQSAGGRIRTWFLTGLVVAGPVAIGRPLPCGPMRYAFEGHVLDTSTRELVGPAGPIDVEPQVFGATLLVLVLLADDAATVRALIARILASGGASAVDTSKMKIEFHAGAGTLRRRREELTQPPGLAAGV